MTGELENATPLLNILQMLPVIYSFSINSRRNCNPLSAWPSPCLLFRPHVLRAWCIPRYTPATTNHFQSWTHQALTCVLHPACEHAALCSIGLATSDYLSKLSGVTCPLEKAFLARLYKYSSCPLPWPRWFRCSFLSVPVAQAAYCYHSTIETIW